MAERRALSYWLGEAAELLLDAFGEIRAHPLRSLLTLSGIVFGAASLVSMTSLAAGMRDMAFTELREMGLPRSYSLRDRDPPSDATRALDLRHPGLRQRDLERLRTLPGVESVMGEVWGGDRLVSGPGGRRLTQVEGVDAGYVELRHYPLTEGRTLAPLDIVRGARVALVGEELRRDLFGDAPPVGRTLTIGGIRFRVIGMVAPFEPQLIPADVSWTARRIYIPYTWLSRYDLGESRVGRAFITVSEAADFPRVMRAGETLLQQVHGGAHDFRTDNLAADVGENLAMAGGILDGWNTVLYTIAGVTLLVGGIGLFSVLLISVRERVREIGIRKALGADEPDILRLFLAESLVLAAAGALLGIAGGAGLILVTKTIARSFGRNFTIGIHLPGVMIAIGFALLVGLLFGWYPARRAARLDPIEAIEA